MNKIIFPRAFAFSIDDLGWNEGSNLSANVPPGPIRVGIKRKFDLNDYKYIINVAREARCYKNTILIRLHNKHIIYEI